MLNNLDLFKTRIIETLTRTESLNETAKALGITSSAVSQNIRALEKVLNQPLFIRVGKKVKPTQLAIDLSQCVQPFFNELATVLKMSSERIAEIKIGAPPIFGTTTLIHELQKVHAIYPGIRISIHVLDTQKILKELIDGKIDFGITDSGVHQKDYRELVFAPLSSEQLVMCCSANFKVTKLSKRISFETLKSLPHIPYHSGKEGLHKWYLHHYKKVPDFHWKLSVDHPYGILTAILNDEGLGVLPLSMVIDRKDIHIIEGPKGSLTSKMHLTQNKGKVPSKMEKDLIAILVRGLRIGI